jgi:phosphatidylinositol alpha-mannosyltransferase
VKDRKDLGLRPALPRRVLYTAGSLAGDPRAGNVEPAAAPGCSTVGTVRIGLVAPYSLTIPGGVQGQVMGLSRSLRSQGHEVRVLAPCDGAPPDAGVTPLGNSVPLATNGSVAPIAPDLPCALRTIRALRDEDFDVVHLHEPLVPGPTLTALLFSEGPLVATFHRAGPSSAYELLRPLVVRLARRPSLRCAVSEDARATAQAALGGEYELVFNGIEIDRFAKASPWPTEGPTIFFIGRHEPRKGLATLLGAVSRLPSSTRLWVAGDGPQTAALTAATASEPRVEWLGRISDEEAASRLRGADVFCAPSIHGESFGVVLLEAMAAHTPIVATDLPGYRAVAHPGCHAVMVRPGDPDALADALTQVLTQPAFAARLADAGEARAQEFGMDRLADRYVALYQRAVEGSCGPSQA